MLENKFKGASNYVAAEDLMGAVNIAIALQKPLLVKGEPGTGKTMLAEAISDALGKDSDHLEHQVHHQGTGRPVRL